MPVPVGFSTTPGSGSADSCTYSLAGDVQQIGPEIIHASNGHADGSIGSSECFRSFLASSFELTKKVAVMQEELIKHKFSSTVVMEDVASQIDAIKATLPSMTGQRTPW